MREKLPTNLPPGARLSANWANAVGRLVNSYSQFVPGSTQHGIRLAGFGSDLPRHPTVVQPFIVINLLTEGEKVDEPQFDTSKEISLLHDELNPHDYIGKMVLWDQTQYPDKNPNGEVVIDLAAAKDRYFLSVAHLPGQFLLPGDDVFGVYDYLNGKFVIVNPPTMRLVTPLEDISSGALGKVEAFREGVPNPDPPPIGTRVISGTRFKAFNLTGQKVTAASNTTYFVTYVEPFSLWFFLPGSGGGGAAKFIHFRLMQELNANQSQAQANIDLLYGTPHGTNEIILVNNPPAGCGGNAYRFEAPAGCRGQAIQDSYTGFYWIWQIDCEGDESSVTSSSPSSSTSTSTSSMSSSSSTSSLSSSSSTSSLSSSSSSSS